MNDKITYTERHKVTKDINEYPNGTLFHSITGGHWIKEKNGFRWCCSHCVFPRPGGDWDGTVSIPESLSKIQQNKEQCRTKEH